MSLDDPLLDRIGSDRENTPRITPKKIGRWRTPRTISGKITTGVREVYMGGRCQTRMRGPPGGDELFGSFGALVVRDNATERRRGGWPTIASGHRGEKGHAGRVRGGARRSKLRGIRRVAPGESAGAGGHR